MLDPEEGRHLPLRVTDKGFPEVPAHPAAAPATSARSPPNPALSVHSRESTRRSVSASGSPGCARTSLSCGHPPAAPFPQCNSPRSPAPAGPWHPPQNAPSSPSTLSPPCLIWLPLSRPHLHPRGLPVSSRRRSWAPGSLPGPRRAWGQVSRLRLRSRCHRQRSRHTRAPHTRAPQPLPPSLPLSPMLSLRQPRSLHPQRAARGRRQGAAAGRDTM